MTPDEVDVAEPIQQVLDKVPAPAIITNADGTQVFKGSDDPRSVQLWTVPDFRNACALIPSLKQPLSWVTASGSPGVEA